MSYRNTGAAAFAVCLAGIAAHCQPHIALAVDVVRCKANDEENCVTGNGALGHW